MEIGVAAHDLGLPLPHYQEQVSRYLHTEAGKGLFFVHTENNQHYTHNELMRHVPFIRDWEHIMMVRDPYARVKSEFRYQLAGNRKPFRKCPSYGKRDINLAIQGGALWENAWDWHTVPQYEYIAGVKKVEIMRVEDLAKDWQRVTGIPVLPSMNRAKPAQSRLDLTLDELSLFFSLLLASIWVAAWLHWSFKGEFRHMLLLYVFPKKWHGPTMPNSEEFMTFSQSEINTYIAGTYNGPHLVRGWLGCPGCMSAAIGLVGAILSLVTGASPWALFILAPCASWLGLLLHRKVL